MRLLRLAALTGTVAVVLASAPASAHTLGVCNAAAGDLDRCERWSDTYSDAQTAPPQRSDQFPSAIAASRTTVFTTVKNVALDPSSPYEATSQWVVLAHDRETGARRWLATRASRPYDSPLAAALSPGGETLYVTGTAYDAFPIAASDGRIVTVAYDTATGEERWAQAWDGLPDGTDAGKTISVSPDGQTLVVGGVTTTEARTLDFVTIAYDARRGREKWARTTGGVRPEGTDVLSATAMSTRGDLVYVAGAAAGAAQYDADFLTVAYSLRNGREVWRAYHDGIGEQKSDRVGGLAVSPDGSRVLVTGDSYGVPRDGRTQYDYATVAYDTDTGAQQWTARYGGPVAGFNAPIGVVAAANTVVVTGQSRGATAGDVRDFGTVAYDLATGAEMWRDRYAPSSSDDIAFHLALSEDGTTAHVSGSSSPTAPYTNLDEVATVAYGVEDGSREWLSRLDIGAGNALSPRALTAVPGGGVALAAQTVRSANPLEGPTSDVYDAVVVAY